MLSPTCRWLLQLAWQAWSWWPVPCCCPLVWAKTAPSSWSALWAGIALYSYVYGQCILQRIMMIAGLFSFNSGNAQGWRVFYIVVATVVCLLVASILLVVGGFFRSVKQAD